MHRFQVPSIDSDHDLIITKFESMIELATTKDYGKQSRQDFIEVFLEYTSSHFKREEEAMREVDYPSFAEHVLAHAFLQHEFRNLLKTLPEDAPNVASDLALFRQMFLFHILTHDEAFGEWLTHHGTGEPETPATRGE